MWQDSGFLNQRTYHIQLTAITLQACLCVFSPLNIRYGKETDQEWKLKTICFYNCLGLSSSVILNFQYLGETALRFDVDIWKRGDFNPFVVLSYWSTSRSDREDLDIHLIFLFLFDFIFFIGGWGKVRGPIYLIISKSTIFKHKPGFDCKKGK